MFELTPIMFEFTPIVFEFTPIVFEFTPIMFEFTPINLYSFDLYISVGDPADVSVHVKNLFIDFPILGY